MACAPRPGPSLERLLLPSRFTLSARLQYLNREGNRFVLMVLALLATISESAMDRWAGDDHLVTRGRDPTESPARPTLLSLPSESMAGDYKFPIHRTYTYIYSDQALYVDNWVRIYLRLKHRQYI